MKRALVMFLLLAACRNDGAAPAAAPSMTLAVDDVAMLDGAGQSRLPLASARHLLARIVTPALPDPVTWITIDLIAPDGAVHARRHVPYSADASVKQVASPDGVPRPIDVQPARAVPGGWALEVAFPVGGTNLQRRPQPGTWRIRAVVDARPDLSFTSTIEFVLDSAAR